MHIEIQKHGKPPEITSIGKQVFKLVTPNLQALSSVLIDRINGVNSKRTALLKSRHKVAEEGLAAAARLLMPYEQESKHHAKSYFQRLEDNR